MRILMGWLILLPFAGVWWLTIEIVNACIKKGGIVRLLGVIVSFLVGGSSIVAGYFIGPIVGWLIMVVGGFVVVIGTWRSVVATKPQLEYEWLEDLQRKQLEGKNLSKSEHEKLEIMWISSKEEAKRMLQQDEINNYDNFLLVRSTLSKYICSVNPRDNESHQLLNELTGLEWRSTIKEAKRILEQGKIDIREKHEREKFRLICYELESRRRYDPEAKGLWLRLQELKESEIRGRKK